MTRFILWPKLPFVAMVTAVIALVVALVAVTIVVLNIQNQATHNRDIFCGFVQPIGIQTAGSQTGRTIVSGAANASTQLGCSPDPYDSK